MKKSIALTMCLMLVLITTCVIVPQQTTTQTEYFATLFNGASDFTDKTFAVSYSERSTNNKVLAIRPPEYVISGVTCVPIAGVNILGYYDRYHDDLIPNFTAGTAYGNYYFYSYYDSNVTNATMQLAADMGLTNPATQGATVAECKSGLTKYCNRKSLNISFTSSIQSKSFSYETAKTQINSGKPIILFCSKFNLAVISQKDNVDSVVLHTCQDPHAMTVLGYIEVTYKLSNGSTRVDKYLSAATGVITLTSSYVYMGSDITIDDAYAITIY